ncbi:ATP-grasp domain-containing protein [Cytobacillus horneckiae]|uniref:DUF4343 domain-containing protein n=1 Tax=Cytobacillus horneckiae TaxID=549687 RepID=A0A2N0ZAX7_9BACI|nr:ATP-grasp domain-containing protein [Cytobacillus horneckiae]MEC1158728.1 ATP-grasp domain-containing protein [Cytobacillus horneckiae]NRG47434.1 ATP-grasp domain-containing protein [Bacillus sp. CRN 9]PKG26662.1 DUF4343 domain-containing protein [Cytobacillus horneckiae]
MKWLVQEFLNNSSNIIRILNALEKCSVDYLLVRVNQDNSLSVIDKENKIPLDNSEEAIQEFILNEQIMVYGSKAFAKIAQDMELEPGSFMNDKFEFEVFQRELGNELLNNEIIYGELSTLYPIGEEFFIRPTGNTKLFTGMTVTKEDFLDWQERENREDSPYIGQSLMIAPIQRIKAEYRFFVVNQKIITGSSYKVGDKINSSCKPSVEIEEYVKQIVDRFPLAKAFVIDIAETEKGLKVVEYNNINTTGLYGCDEIAFVRAINELDFNRRVK